MVIDGQEGYRPHPTSISIHLPRPDPNHKVLVNTVQQALKMGADGVSVHINIGADDEAKMLGDLGAVAVECMEWGVPLLAMMYRGDQKLTMKAMWK